MVYGVLAAAAAVVVVSVLSALHETGNSKQLISCEITINGYETTQPCSVLIYTFETTTTKAIRIAAAPPT